MKNLFLMISVILILISCKPKKDKENSSSTENYKEQNVDEKLITFALYSLDSNGRISPDKQAEKFEYKMIKPKNILKIKKESIPSKIFESVNQAKNFIATLDSSLIFTDIVTEKKLSKGCYYSAFDSDKNIFFMDKYHKIEPFLSYLTEDLEISYSGIVCVNSDSKAESFASNNSYFNAETSLLNLKSLLKNIGISIVGEKGLSLGFPGLKILVEEPIPVKSTPKSRASPNTVADLPMSPKEQMSIVFKSIRLSPVERKIDSFFDSVEDFSTFGSGSRGKLKDGSTFEVGQQIGNGSFGTVHKLYISKNGKTDVFAAKIFRNKSNNQLAPDLTETKNSPFFLRTYPSSNPAVQISELGGENLSNKLDAGAYAGQSADKIAARSEVFHDIFDGISILHQKELKSHWDLKPNNMLLGRDGRVKIIDLDDVSAPNVPDAKDKPGAFSFASPERVEAQIDGILVHDYPVNGMSSDIYSLGVSLLNAKYPNKNSDLDEMIRACCNMRDKSIQQSTKYGFGKTFVDRDKSWAHLDEHIKQMPNSKEKDEMRLIADMLKINPTARPTISDVKSRWESIYPRPENARNDMNTIAPIAN